MSRRKARPADLPAQAATDAITGTAKPKRTRHGNIRTEYGGRMYDSKAEARRAEELDREKAAGLIVDWFPQVTFQLGPDHTYRVDFLVYSDAHDLWAEDVKGHETARFKKSKKLWRKYMRIPLRVIKAGKIAETVLPGEVRS